MGARPQFIKAAPVSRALKAIGVPEVLVHTGQHYDDQMSLSLWRELDLPPASHDLGIHGGSNTSMVSRMMRAIDDVLEVEDPAAVLVYGDTNSTLAGALAATGRSIPLAHVEAGMRSFDRGMPEERNRILTDHLSAALFCATSTAEQNLQAEGITEGVERVGDVMYDSARAMGSRAVEESKVLEHHGLEPGQYAVATVHRPANTDDPESLRRVLDYLAAHAEKMPVILPAHPRLRAAISSTGISPTSLLIVDPVGYLDMTRLVGAAALVLTDSGGLQKEAYFHGVPCVTLRDSTEWPETIASGWNRLWTAEDYQTPRRPIDEYGDGNAAGRIAQSLELRLEAK